MSENYMLVQIPDEEMRTAVRDTHNRNVLWFSGFTARRHRVVSWLFRSGVFRVSKRSDYWTLDENRGEWVGHGLLRIRIED